MFIRLSATALLVFIFALFTGCSRGNNPVMLSQHDMDTIDSTALIPIGVADRFSDGSPASGMGAMGLFNLYVDSVNGTAELTSLRQTALTDVLEVVDITNFLQMAPCYDCARIGSVSLDADSNLVVSIGIKHPFPAGDPLKPISGKNRGDLHVFNIEGTIISNAAGKLFAYIGETAAGFTLVNADGYTGYLDDSLDEIYPTDATVHPYILHFDDYTAGNFDAANPMGFDSVTDPPPNGNLVMAMGCDYDYRNYVFNLDGGYMDFIYAVGCTYAITTEVYGMRFDPEYRVPQHNKKAASELWVEIVSNNLEEDDTLSTAEIEINVVDISHDISVGNALNEMLADSSVNEITVEIPGVMIDILVIDGGSAISGTGHDPSDPLVFAATITNTASGIEGSYTGLVKVIDSYSPGLNELPLLNGMDGIKRVGPIENPLTGLFDISEFATYALFEMPVVIVNEDPVAELSPVDEEIAHGNTIEWDATASYDTDGTIDTYEFDFELPDGDPLQFISDGDCTDGIMESGAYNDLGTFYAAVQVTDNFGATDIAVVSFDVIEQIFPIWQTTQGNVGNTGCVGLYGPSNPLGAPVWETDECVWNALQIFLNEDMAFVSTVGSGSTNGYTAALNLSDGSLAWTKAYDDSANTYLACKGLSEDGSIVFCAQSNNGTLYGLDASDGTEIWNTSGSIKCDANLTLDLDGNFIVPASDGIRSMDPQTGAINWTASIGNTYYCTPAVGPDGTIYAYSSISNCPLYALDPATGTNNWSSTINIGECHNGITVHPTSGNIIIHCRVSGTGYLRCFQDNGTSGTQLWQQEYPYTWYSSTAVGANGDIYLIDYSGTVRRLDPSDGLTIDSYSAGGNGYAAHPVIGEDGLVYIGFQGYLMVFNPDCSLASSSSNYNNAYIKGPAIGQDGTIYGFNYTGVRAWRD